MLDESDVQQIAQLQEKFNLQASIVFESIKELQQIIDKEKISDDEKTGTSSEGIRHLIEQLDEALKQGDVKSSALLEKLGPMILTQDSGLSDMVGDLNTHIENYDFDKAIISLLALKERLLAVSNDYSE